MNWSIHLKAISINHTKLIITVYLLSSKSFRLILEYRQDVHRFNQFFHDCNGVNLYFPLDLWRPQRPRPYFHKYIWRRRLAFEECDEAWGLYYVFFPHFLFVCMFVCMYVCICARKCIDSFIFQTLFLGLVSHERDYVARSRLDCPRSQRLGP